MRIPYESYEASFKDEFGQISSQFERVKLVKAKDAFVSYQGWCNAPKLQKPELPGMYPCCPGIYIFWHRDGNELIAWRVGKSRKHVFKRAMEHIRDGTHDENHSIEIESNDDHLFLEFFITNNTDMHWLVALEEYFEEKLKPLIPSRRC